MIINLKNIVKFYDGKPILKDLNLCIKDVSVVGIIGRSGCGKSTLMRQMMGIETLDSGTITINGTEINKENLEEYQNRIGVVFQNHNLFPHLSLKENVSLVLRKSQKISKTEADAKSIKLFKEFSLEDQAEKRPGKVSGGQAQRASIVRAIATNPELIFMDEPTAALDPQLTKEVLNSIQALKNRGAEFVFVTHEMDFLKKFADYFIFMDDGNIIEYGNIKKLDHPKTKKLKDLLD